jgi:hypothetical protein
VDQLNFEFPRLGNRHVSFKNNDFDRSVRNHFGGKLEQFFLYGLAVTIVPNSIVKGIPNDMELLDDRYTLHVSR